MKIRNVTTAIWVMVCICCLCLPKTTAAEYLNDGLTHSISWRINASLFVENYPFTGGMTTVILRPGGSVTGYLHVYDSSRVYLSGGSAERTLSAHDNSRITIRGGFIGDEVHAGIRTSDNNTITIEGSNFAINGTSVGYGEYNRDNFAVNGTGSYANDDLSYVIGTLSGTLASGDLMNNEFYVGDNARILLVPEPTTLLLLGLGGLMLRRKYN